MNKKEQLIRKIIEEYIEIENAVYTNDTFVDDIKKLLEKHLPEDNEGDGVIFEMSGYRTDKDGNLVPYKVRKDNEGDVVEIKRDCVNCFCNNCGKFLDISYNYCFECGKKIKRID